MRKSEQIHARKERSVVSRKKDEKKNEQSSERESEESRQRCSGAEQSANKRDVCPTFLLWHMLLYTFQCYVSLKSSAVTPRPIPIAMARMRC